MMSDKTFKNELSKLPWTKTRLALDNLQQLLLCNACHELPTSPQYMGRCDHFFCEDCISKLTDNFCPICQIPSPPCDRKPDIIVRGLVSSVSEMFSLINGEKIMVKFQSLEAPESSIPFSSNPMKNKDQVSTRKCNKENVEAVASKSHPCTTNSNPGTNVKISKHKMEISHSAKIIKKNTQLESNGVKKTTLSSSKIKPIELNPPNAAVAVVLTKINETPTTPQNKSVKPPNLSALGITPVTPAINKRNMKGETPLHIASIKCDVAKVKSLLEDGANPNTKDNAGWTPLHEACSQGFEHIATLLLEHGALVDVPGSYNMTPLHDAVMSETVPVISLLRRWGASDVVRDILGRTARYLADLTKCPRNIHSALDTKKDPLLIPKNTLGPLQTRMVILDSSLSPEHKKKLEKVSKIMKAKLVSEFSSDVTHFVARCDDNRNVCQRTIKYMMCVVAGKWILSHKWLDACLSDGGPANPLLYEIEGTTSSPCSFAPNKGRMNSSKMLPGLFSGCHVFFCGSFADPNLPSKKELEALVRAGDGIALQREPNPESIDASEQTVPFHSNPDGPLARCSHYCIYVEGLNEPQLKYDMAHIKSLPLSWLYECVDQWCLVDSVK